MAHSHCKALYLQKKKKKMMMAAGRDLLPWNELTFIRVLHSNSLSAIQNSSAKALT